MVTDIEGRARALHGLIQANAQESEQLGRQAQATVDGLLGAGVFDMNVPAAIGGPEVDGRTYLSVIEAVSEADGSAGWCVMIGAELNGTVGMRLEPRLARRLLFDEGPICVAGSFIQAAPSSVLRHGDGYRVSGRWRFASGCYHSAYIAPIAPLFEGEAPVIANGRPVIVNALVEQERLELHDAWRVAGLRGTGSTEFSAANVRVEPEMTWIPGTPAYHTTTMSRVPQGAFLAMGKAAVATGIARGAIDAFLLLADRKPVLAARSVRDEPRIQLQVADAEATVQSARGFLYNAMQELWEHSSSGEKATVRQAAMLRLASVHATAASAHAVELMYHAAGSSSLFESSPLQRALRDVHAVRQHMNVADRFREDAGRVLLGLPPQEPMF